MSNQSLPWVRPDASLDGDDSGAAVNDLAFTTEESAVRANESDDGDGQVHRPVAAASRKAGLHSASGS
jgi:hypothetical protein